MDSTPATWKMQETGIDTGVANREQRSTPELERPTWDIAFFGIVAYLVVEYTRLPAMFPILEVLQTGKLAIAMSAIGLLLGIRAGRSALRSLDLILWFFILAVMLSSIFAQDSSIAFIAFSDVLRWGIIVFLISRIVNDEKRLRIFLLILIVLNVKLAQHAVRDYGAHMGGSYEAQLLSSRGVGAGSTGFFGNPGDFGVAMCTIWPLAGAAAFGERNRYWKLALIGGWIIILFAILLCGSRGALLGAGVATLVAVFKHPSRVTGIFTVAIFAAAVFFVLPDANKDRFQSGMSPEKDKTAAIRLTLWTNATRMFEDHPVFGVGLGNFPVVYKTKYAPADAYANQAWEPHSIYMQSLSEIGLVGSVPLVLLWLAFFRANHLTRKMVIAQGGDRKSFQYRLASGLDLALVGYLVSGAFLTVLYYPHLWILCGLSAALYSSCTVTPQFVRATSAGHGMAP